MTAIQARPLDLDSDLERRAGESGIEFVGGQYIEKPMSIETAEIEIAVGALLRAHAMKTGEVRVLGSSVGYRCYAEDPRKFRKPDLSVIRNDRLKGIDPREGFLQIPADLVIEVVSPNDLAYDVAAKVQEYLGHGFKQVWIVNPHRRTVEDYHAAGSIRLLREDAQITAAELLPGFSCRVADFFIVSRE